MARPLRIQFPGAFYHITCRGNTRRKIFLDDEDRQRFVIQLAESLDTYHVVLYTYILMPNHFHLLIQTTRANLSEFMRRFNICYTGWFNYHHGRSGHLYQGRYKAFLVDADNYALEVSRYVHLNMMRVKDVRSVDFRRRWQYVMGYRWSSLPGYLHEKQIVRFVNYDFILSMIGGRRPYREFMYDGLRHKIANPFERAKGSVILGSDDFVAKVKKNYVEYGSLREQPSYRDLVVDTVKPEVVMVCIADVLKIDRSLMLKRGKHGVVRGIIAELLYKYSGLTQAQIGRFLGNADYAAVYQLRRRLKERMRRDNHVRNKYMKVEKKLKKMLNVEI